MTNILTIKQVAISVLFFMAALLTQSCDDRREDCVGWYPQPKNVSHNVIFKLLDQETKLPIMGASFEYKVLLYTFQEAIDKDGCLTLQSDFTFYTSTTDAQGNTSLTISTLYRHPRDYVGIEIEISKTNYTTANYRLRLDPDQPTTYKTASLINITNLP